MLHGYVAGYATSYMAMLPSHHPLSHGHRPCYMAIRTRYTTVFSGYLYHITIMHNLYIVAIWQRYVAIRRLFGYTTSYMAMIPGLTTITLTYGHSHAYEMCAEV